MPRNNDYESEYAALKADLKRKYGARISDVLKLSREKIKLTIYELAGEELLPLVERFEKAFIELNGQNERLNELVKTHLSEEFFIGEKPDFNSDLTKTDNEEVVSDDSEEKESPDENFDAIDFSDVERALAGLKEYEPEFCEQYGFILRELKKAEREIAFAVNRYAAPIAADETAIKNSAKTSVLKLVAQYNVELRNLKTAFGKKSDELELPFEGEKDETEDGKTVVRLQLNSNFTYSSGDFPEDFSCKNFLSPNDDEQTN